MHRPKKRFFSAVARKETSQETKYEEMGTPIYFILWIKDQIDR